MPQRACGPLKLPTKHRIRASYHAHHSQENSCACVCAWSLVHPYCLFCTLFVIGRHTLVPSKRFDFDFACGGLPLLSAVARYRRHSRVFIAASSANRTNHLSSVLRSTRTKSTATVPRKGNDGRRKKHDSIVRAVALQLKGYGAVEPAERCEEIHTSKEEGPTDLLQTEREKRETEKRPRRSDV